MSNDKWNPAKFEMFSEHKIAIMRKLHEHPPLVTLLMPYDQATEWPEMLGEIAAYCGIAIDGTFGPTEIEALEKELAQKLWEAGVVLGNTPVVGTIN